MYTTNVDKEIENEIIELNKKLFKIKCEGWHESVRKGPTGIGKTLENLLDKEEDVNGKIKCRNSVKNFVGFPTFFIC